MGYDALFKLYYKDKNIWQETLDSRRQNEFTKHIPFSIKQYGFKESYDLFYCHNDEMLIIVNSILDNILRLISCIEMIPQAGIRQFMDYCIVEEIKATNDIEGVHSTRREIKTALMLSSSPKYVRFSGIVKKYNMIISKSYIELCESQDIRNLYDSFILQEIIKEEPKNEPDGVIFRKDSVDVVSNTQKTLHRGVYPEEKIISDMDRALAILHDKSMPGLIRIAIFHYLFAYIHPFYDGNGRMIRFITSYLLAKEVNPVVAMRLSILLKVHKKEYYSLFENTNKYGNGGDMTPFITGFLKLILMTIFDTESLLKSKMREYMEYCMLYSKLTVQDKLTDAICNILIQAAIFSDFGATIDEMAETVRKSRKTVQKRLESIPEELIVADRTSKPYHFKFNLAYLDMLRD